MNIKTDTRRGLVNGEVREQNRIRQNHNRQKNEGFTNGAGGGFTNGTRADKVKRTNGMTNGVTNGMTNGLANNAPNISTTIKKIPTLHQKKTSKKTIAAGIIAIILISLILFQVPSTQSPPTIDGEFGEWNELIDVGFANIGLQKDGNNLFIGLQRPNILRGQDNITEAYYIFINDKSLNEGFYVGYDTYEYYIDLFGCNDEIGGLLGYRFDESVTQNKWQGFRSKYKPFTISGTNNNNFVEFSVRGIMLGKTNITDIDLLIYHFNTEGNYEYSQVINVDNTTHASNVGLTRSNTNLYYEHVFETNTLRIETGQNLAYTCVDYSIRVLQLVSDTNNNKGTNINNQTNSSETSNTLPELTSDNTEDKSFRGTKIKIDYDYWKSDIITQCGGILINSTIDDDNLLFEETSFTIYNMNHTVVKCTIEGDFNQEIVQLKSRGVLLSYSTNSKDEIQPYGTISKMTAYVTTQSINIDGILTESAWEDVADNYTVDLTEDIKIFTMRNSTSLLVGIISLDDEDETGYDFSEIYFDCDHDGTTQPDTNDKKYKADSTDIYYEGTGSGWCSTTIPDGWDGEKSSTDGATSYEFMCELSDLNEAGNFDANGETVGFGVYVKSGELVLGDTRHIFYPDAYNKGVSPTVDYRDKPDTWSDVEYIPEINDVVVLVSALLILNMAILYKRRRNEGKDV